MPFSKNTRVRITLRLHIAYVPRASGLPAPKPFRNPSSFREFLSRPSCAIVYTLLALCGSIEKRCGSRYCSTESTCILQASVRCRGPFGSGAKNGRAFLHATSYSVRRMLSHSRVSGHQLDVLSNTSPSPSADFVFSINGQVEMMAWQPDLCLALAAMPSSGAPCPSYPWTRREGFENLLVYCQPLDAPWNLERKELPLQRRISDGFR